MIRSKDIQDYISVPLERILPGKVVTFDLHLYLPQNRHIMILRQRGDAPSADFLEKYQSKGIRSVWIHQDDKTAFQEYLRISQAPASTQAKKLPRTEMGAFLAETLTQPASSDTEKLEKSEKLASAAKSILQGLAGSGPDQDRSRAMKIARMAIQDVLDATALDCESLIAQIWAVDDVEQELGHSVNVATYSILFSLAFGRIDPELIADIGLAGLLHDVGLTQVSAADASVPETSMGNQETSQVRKNYRSHVEQSVRLIEQFLPEIPKRVLTLIQQHHEKFDGTGYPEGLKGFKFDDIAQLISMGDLLDAIASGGWDGIQRVIPAALKKLQELEREKMFPQYFNPEIFSAVMKWTSSTPEEIPMSETVQIVRDQAKKIAS